MASDLNLKQGIYDPTKQFEFTNITDKPFVFTWNSNPVTVEAGEKVRLPHHLAVLATGRLVDQIMSEDIRIEEEKVRVETKNPYYRSPRGLSLAIPAQRRPFEEKILKELPALKVNDAEAQVIRIQKKEELLRDLKQENAPKIEKISETGSMSTAKEFEEINLPDSKK